MVGQIFSHFFNINFEEDAEIFGVENILSTYRESLSKVELSGNIYLYLFFI